MGELRLESHKDKHTFFNCEVFQDNSKFQAKLNSLKEKLQKDYDAKKIGNKI